MPGSFQGRSYAGVRGLGCVQLLNCKCWGGGVNIIFFRWHSGKSVGLDYLEFGDMKC